jgi:hypothetical protein
MNIETINRYQRWAARGYLAALTCINHAYHNLVPIQQIEGIFLICPRGDYQKDIGQAEYLAIKRKVEMAEFLWRMQ